MRATDEVCGVEAALRYLENREMPAKLDLRSIFFWNDWIVFNNAGIATVYDKNYTIDLKKFEARVGKEIAYET